MNREGAETFLRLLAEAEMRDQLTPQPPPWAGGPGAGRVKVNVVGQALTAVGALDRETVQDILADFDLAVSLRRLHDEVRQGPARTRPPAAHGLPGRGSVYELDYTYPGGTEWISQIYLRPTRRTTSAGSRSPHRPARRCAWT